MNRVRAAIRRGAAALAVRARRPVPIAALAAAFVSLAFVPVSFAQEKASPEVIYPRDASSPDALAQTQTGPSNSYLLVIGVAAAAAGGWVFWRQRQASTVNGARVQRRLAIAETRSLGNRQYLVVADYDGRKFLLGVCPGSISMLTALDGDSPPGEIDFE